MSKTYGSYFTSFKCILVIPGPYCFSLQNLTQNHLLLDANCTTTFGGPRLSLLCPCRFCSMIARTAISEEFCPILWCESDSVYFPWPSHLGGFLPAGHWAVSVGMTRRVQKSSRLLTPKLAFTVGAHFDVLSLRKRTGTELPGQFQITLGRSQNRRDSFARIPDQCAVIIDDSRPSQTRFQIHCK